MNRQSPNLEQITDELKQADGNIVIEAGAGTGKTYNLTNRILHQVAEKGVSLDQILAMTFTDYAAAEMRERVYKVISEAIETEKDENKRRHLIRQKRDFSKNYISTFHSFCSRILKYYPDEVAEIPIPKFPGSLNNEPYGQQSFCHLDSGFEVLGTYDEILLKQELLKEFYKIYKHHPPLQAQLNAIRYTVLEQFLEKLGGKEEGDLLKVAGLSAADYLNCLKGLLKDMMARRQSIADQAWQIIQSNLGWFKKPGDIIGWEYFADHCLKKDGPVRKNKMVKEQQEAVEEHLDPLLIEYRKQEKITQPLKDYLKGDEAVLLEELKDYRNNDEFDPNHETWHNLIELADISLRWSTFLRYKRVSKRTLNFDDIIWYIRRLFKEKPYIGRALSTRFRYIMIDEFQDTDEKQWEIIKALASLDTESKVLIVGDIKQAIYGFRGGDVTMMDRARQELQAANSDAYRVVRLSWSFRSNDTIINFVNSLFSHCFNQEEVRKPYMAEAQRLLRPQNKIGREKNHPGQIRIMEGPAAEAAFDPDELNRPARKLYEDESCRLEALRIADFLDQIRQGKQPGYERITKMMKQGISAVGMLFKRRKNQHYYEQALKLYNLPFTVSSGRGFFNRQEIMDCHNLLAFLQDAFDDLSLVGVLRSPFIGLSDAGLLAVRNAMDEPKSKRYSTYWQAIADWKSWGEKALIPPDKLALEMISFLKRLRDKTPYSRVSELLEEAVFETNFLNGYIREPQARQNVIKLMDIVRQLEMSGRGNMFEIVSFLRIQMEEEVVEADAELPDPGIIQLMTIHGSKGLEFPMVILPDMCAYNSQGGNRIYETPLDEQLFGLPVFSYNPKDRDGKEDSDKSVIHKVISEQCKQRDKAELIRLFYVAATRAESHLLFGYTVNYCKSKTDHREGSFSKLLQGWLAETDPDSSPFVHDILNKEKIEELSNRISAGYKMPVNGEKPKGETINFDKLRKVSGSASRGVRTVTQSKEAGAPGWNVQNQWVTISAADAGTLIHRAIEINPDFENSSELLANLAASLGYPGANKLIEENGEALQRHIVNARSCLDANFPGAPRTMKEVPFEVTDDRSLDAKFIRGTIDMLIQNNSGHWCLIDFKTALPEESVLSEFSGNQGYIDQLQLYQKAFEELTSGTITDDRVYILYTGFNGGRLLSLEELLSESNSQFPT